MNAEETFGESSTYKIVVMGDSGAGKTSVIFRYANGQFDPYYDTTIGTSFVLKRLTEFDSKKSLKIWDTAGQERYRSMVPMYCQGASAILIIFDLSNQKSAESIQRWYEYANQSISPETPIFIAGNKVDLIENESLINEIVNNTVFEDKKVYLVSAKTGQNIEQLFNEIAHNLIGNTKKSDVERIDLNSTNETQSRNCC